ncbi:MAG: Gldg family protein [Planctomycetaceae bacterium]
MIHSHVLWSVFKRNVLSFFSGMLGYLFIIVFVVAGSFAAFDDSFFINGECTLDLLTQWFPVLLLFIVPAITMSAWSDEKKLGTDELLFTLPGTDFDILIGKYLAVLFTYTVVLSFSFSHAIVLDVIGNPDWGVLLPTYLGYWSAGAALLAIGMFASVLTTSSTVAFVLAAAFCCVPVYIDTFPGVSLLKDWLNFYEPLSIGGHLRDFSLGMVPVFGLAYFAMLTVFFLYLNAVFIARRHWGGSPRGVSYGWQFTVRVASLVVMLIAFGYMTAKASNRLNLTADFTAEKLYTLAETTRVTLQNVPESRPIQIDAYVSQEIPEEYQQIRKNIEGVLRQIERTSGNRVKIRITETPIGSKEADEAAEWGITTNYRTVEQSGRRDSIPMILGAVVRSGFDEVVIPFFDKGTPIEYEFTRSIGTLTREKRKTIGILQTKHSPMGDFSDDQSGRRRVEWRIVDELRKQYIVKSVSAKVPIEGGIDVLIATQPSTLATTEEIRNLTDYIRGGNPVLMIDDSWAQNLPLDDFPGWESGFPLDDVARQKKDAYRALMRTIGIAASPTLVLFDTHNPHLSRQEFAPEIAFLTDDQLSDKEEPCINRESLISSPFREVVVMFSGVFTRDPAANLDFVPLLRSRQQTTGVHELDELYRTNDEDVFGLINSFSIYDKDKNLTLTREELSTHPEFQQFLPMFPRIDLNRDNTLSMLELRRTFRRPLVDANRIPAPAVSDSQRESRTKAQNDFIIAAQVKSKRPQGVNVIFMSDIDFIADDVFQAWETQYFDFPIDNILFFLNCVDSLMDNDEYYELRGRYREPRKIEWIERERSKYLEEYQETLRAMRKEQAAELQGANARFFERQEEIRVDNRLDPRTKEALLKKTVQEETARYQREQQRLAREAERVVNDAKNRSTERIRAVQDFTRTWALLLPPIPAILVGLMVIGWRLLAEYRAVSKDRMVKR